MICCGVPMGAARRGRRLPQDFSLRTLACLLVLAAGPLLSGVKMQVRGGRPVVDGVYVNGHGPYRFLIDTGTNVNLIETRLARSIGLTPTYRTELTSSSGVAPMSARGGIDVELDTAKADEQVFLFSELEAIHQRWNDIQGVLGQAFLSRFDYLLDLRGKRLDFGKQDRSGPHSQISTVNGRTAVTTSLGDLILDSGASMLILFGVQPDLGLTFRAELRTFSGSRQVGAVWSELMIEGRSIWRGVAVAMPHPAESGANGLLPVNLFKSIYVSNSEGYVVFE